MRTDRDALRSRFSVRVACCKGIKRRADPTHMWELPKIGDPYSSLNCRDPYLIRGP